MPQHKSCKKRMKTSEVERERNRALRSQMTKVIKNLRNCKTRAEADAIIGDVTGLIDRASRQNIIHKNKAARDKSRLMAFVKNLSA